MSEFSSDQNQLTNHHYGSGFACNQLGCALERSSICYTWGREVGNCIVSSKQNLMKISGWMPI